MGALPAGAPERLDRAGYVPQPMLGIDGFPEAGAGLDEPLAPPPGAFDVDLVRTWRPVG